MTRYTKDWMGWDKMTWPARNTLSARSQPSSRMLKASAGAASSRSSIKFMAWVGFSVIVMTLIGLAGLKSRPNTPPAMQRMEKSKPNLQPKVFASGPETQESRSLARFGPLPQFAYELDIGNHTFVKLPGVSAVVGLDRKL